jgi:predicted metal-binding membrane protein
MSAGDGVLGAVLRRDRAVVLAALTAITLLAWLYVVILSMRTGMPPATSMPGMAMNTAMLAPALGSWTPTHFAFIFAMWAVMMVGMMTPSVAPMILIYAQVARRASPSGGGVAPAGWFAAGYLLVWIGFSALASVAQWALDRAAMLTPMMASANQVLGGAVLIAVGAFQWTPLKDSCLAQCRAPLSFIQRHGGFGLQASTSLRLGLLHGGYCVGCCWAIMALLFVGGVMNLLWIAAIMAFVLLEKLSPMGPRPSKAAGLGAILAGAWMLSAGIVRPV